MTTLLRAYGAVTRARAPASAGRRQFLFSSFRCGGSSSAALAIYLLAQSTVVLATGYHPRHSPLGITWTASPAWQ
jgi:hypothetical protein